MKLCRLAFRREAIALRIAFDASEDFRQGLPPRTFAEDFRPFHTATNAPFPAKASFSIAKVRKKSSVNPLKLLSFLNELRRSPPIARTETELARCRLDASAQKLHLARRTFAFVCDR